MPRSGKISHANSLVLSKDPRKLEKGQRESRDRHKDFIGGLECKKKTNSSISGERPSPGRLKGSQLVEKRGVVEYQLSSKENIIVKS